MNVALRAFSECASQSASPRKAFQRTGHIAELVAAVCLLRDLSKQTGSWQHLVHQLYLDTPKIIQLCQCGDLTPGREVEQIKLNELTTRGRPWSLPPPSSTCLAFTVK